MHEHQPQALSTDLPAESPLRFLRRPNAAAAKSLSYDEEQSLAAELNRTVEAPATAKSPSDEEEQGLLAAELERTVKASQATRTPRTAAYRDAITVVAREMQRRGQDLTCWTENDAEAASEIADILISLDSQGATAPDLAFAR
jgi:hypothetical protein